ncbi:MAG: hypothetical protein KF862_09770 [Chitinophagaceae bacterium]|nr:hypothetical protein [Chitinophagaceae bacterium]
MRDFRIQRKIYTFRAMTTPVYYNPEHLYHEQLDALLSMGWYRMHQSVFTTTHIFMEDRSLRVFWLRYVIPALQFSKKQQKLLQQNQRFSVVNKPIIITDEMEELYALYKTVIAFEPSPSVAEWLYGEEGDKGIFDTHVIEIRDADKLIAAGIYDKGKNSIAGIMNFYHPQYRKFSLGKYLVLLKVQYAKAFHCKWYYPGYITYGYPAFDYKLFLGEPNVEVFLPELYGWHPYNKDVISNLGSGSI